MPNYESIDFVCGVRTFKFWRVRVSSKLWSSNHVRTNLPGETIDFFVLDMISCPDCRYPKPLYPQGLERACVTFPRSIICVCVLIRFNIENLISFQMGTTTSASRGYAALVCNVEYFRKFCGSVALPLQGVPAI